MPIQGPEHYGNTNSLTLSLVKPPKTHIAKYIEDPVPSLHTTNKSPKVPESAKDRSILQENLKT
jgi:hypothetical protein